QIATVIITVDLHCCTCSKKIKKTLCKLQSKLPSPSLSLFLLTNFYRFNIESIVYDEKKNTITVSGPFNPDCFIKKLRCLACKVIICVQIKPKPVKPPPPPPPPKVEVEVNLDVCVFPPPGWPNCCACDGPPPSASCRPC
ncbi:unnamed protein product, partial [Musa hybrid cultivar]